jgi:hypothetical protein
VVAEDEMARSLQVLAETHRFVQIAPAIHGKSRERCRQMRGTIIEKDSRLERNGYFWQRDGIQWQKARR